MVTPGVSPRPHAGGRAGSASAWSLLWGAIGVGALLLLAKSVQNSGEFGRLQPWILLLNVCGVIALSMLLARKLWQLVRDYRDHVPGSRLTARTVGDLRRAGDRAAAHRLSVLARVPQSRHRQLVHASR